MKKWDIFSRICHWWECFWDREWAGLVEGWTTGGYQSYHRKPVFVWVDRCNVCGQVRARYKDDLGYTCSVDMDRLILETEGQVPYEVGTHKKLTPDTEETCTEE